jgi:hypothetical protein
MGRPGSLTVPQGNVRRQLQTPCHQQSKVGLFTPCTNAFRCWVSYCHSISLRLCCGVTYEELLCLASTQPKRDSPSILREAKEMELTGTSRGSPAVLGIPNRLADGDAPHTNDVVWGTRTHCSCAPGNTVTVSPA